MCNIQGCKKLLLYFKFFFFPFWNGIFISSFNILHLISYESAQKGCLWLHLLLQKIIRGHSTKNKTQEKFRKYLLKSLTQNQRIVRSRRNALQKPWWVVPPSEPSCMHSHIKKIKIKT